MAGFFLYSVDAEAFDQLTSAPTKAQCLSAADAILDDLADRFEDFVGEEAADTDKWPSARVPLAKVIRKRLISLDWYADLTLGDGVLWSDVVFHMIQDDVMDFRNDNDGFLQRSTTSIAARKGASMMSEHLFGRSGYRYSGQSLGELDLNYTIYLPDQATELLEELEVVIPHFESLPDLKDGERDQFFRGLLEPLKQIVAEERVMWVQTDL